MFERLTRATYGKTAFYLAVSNVNVLAIDIYIYIYGACTPHLYMTMSAALNMCGRLIGLRPPCYSPIIVSGMARTVLSVATVYLELTATLQP